MMELKVGEYYNVSCAEIMMNGDGGTYYIPVFDHLHADPQFGFLHKHYHIDGRFDMHPRMVHEFSLSGGHTAAVIVPESGGLYKFIRITFQSIKCLRLETGLSVPDRPTEKQKPKVEQYNRWYESFVGQICTGRKCPHLGTAMLEKDGRLVCPMHDLTADLKTLEVFRR